MRTEPMATSLRTLIPIGGVSSAPSLRFPKGKTRVDGVYSLHPTACFTIISCTPPSFPSPPLLLGVPVSQSKVPTTRKVQQVKRPEFVAQGVTNHRAGELNKRFLGKMCKGTLASCVRALAPVNVMQTIRDCSIIQKSKAMLQKCGKRSS